MFVIFFSLVTEYSVSSFFKTECSIFTRRVPSCVMWPRTACPLMYKSKKVSPWHLCNLSCLCFQLAVSSRLTCCQCRVANESDMYVSHPQPSCSGSAGSANYSEGSTSHWANSRWADTHLRAGEAIIKRNTCLLVMAHDGIRDTSRGPLVGFWMLV